MNSTIGDIIQIFSAAFSVIAVILGFFWGMIKFLDTQKIKKEVYYIARGVFSDRTESLYNIVRSIKSRNRIINVYGTRGIGKSAFLRFFADYINGTLKKKNKRSNTVQPSLSKPWGRALYVELSSYGSRSIEDQIITRLSDNDCTLAQFAEQTRKRLSFNRKIFIILDNVNNIALGRELESIIDIFLSCSKKYYVIVGSIEKQPFLNALNEKKLGFIELKAFEEDDIFDFAYKNAEHIPVDYIKRIIEFSKGLPVFVSFMLNNISANPISISYDNSRMDQYIERILEDLTAEQLMLTKYIAFLSITSTLIPIAYLHEFHLTFSQDDLNMLENSSLIEQDSKVNAP